MRLVNAASKRGGNVSMSFSSYPSSMACRYDMPPELESSKLLYMQPSAKTA